VVANLQALRNARSLRPSDVQFRPVTIRRFVERYWQFTRGEDGEEDPGWNDR
jgi:hypothetical protein